MKRLAVSVVLLFIILQATFCSGLENPNKYNQIYVSSVGKLSFEYFYEKGSKTEKVEFALQHIVYQKMAYICTAIKVLNEMFTTHSILDASSLIPDSPNVLMACCGTLKIGEKGQVVFHYKPNPLKDQDSFIYVFMSGKEEGTYRKQIEEIYNNLLYDKRFGFDDGKIKILSSPKSPEKLGHTEELFLEIISKRETHKDAVVIDVFSWLDVCKHCAIKMKEFYEEKANFPVIFRVVSQKQYDAMLPDDLHNGYEKLPAFAELREKHLIPVTRMNWEENVIKDIVISDLQSTIAYLILERDITFWAITNLGRSLFDHISRVKMFVLHKFPIDAALIEAYNYFTKDESELNPDDTRKHYDSLVKLSKKTSEREAGDIFLRECRRRSTGKTELSKAEEWIRVLRGKAILFLPDYKDHLNELRSKCLLYTCYKEDLSEMLSYIEAYEHENQRRNVGWNFDGPDDIERKNIEKLKELLVPHKDYDTTDEDEH